MKTRFEWGTPDSRHKATGFDLAVIPRIGENVEVVSDAGKIKSGIVHAVLWDLTLERSPEVTVRLL